MKIEVSNNTARDINAKIINLIVQSGGDMGQVSTLVSQLRLIDLSDLVDKQPGQSATDGAFLKAPTRENARRAASAAITDAALGDKLATFEAQPFIDRLSVFLLANPSFVEDLAQRGAMISIRQMPEDLLLWARANRKQLDPGAVERLSGMAAFLGCRFGKALSSLGPYAHEPEIALCLGETALHLAQFPVALAHFQRVRPYLRHGAPDATRRLALVHSNIGACHEGLLERERALDHLREALRLLPPTTLRPMDMTEDDELDQLARAVVLNNLGFSLLGTAATSEPCDEAALEEAERSFHEALKIRRGDVTGMPDIAPNLARVEINLASLARMKGGDPGAVLTHYANAEAALETVPGGHVLSATIANRRGLTLFENGRYADALEAFQTTKMLLARHSAADSENALMVDYSIAQVLIAQNHPDRFNAILKLHARALEVMQDPNAGLVTTIEEDLQMLKLNTPWHHRLN